MKTTKSNKAAAFAQKHGLPVVKPTEILKYLSACEKYAASKGEREWAARLKKEWWSGGK